MQTVSPKPVQMPAALPQTASPKPVQTPAALPQTASPKPVQMPTAVPQPSFGFEQRLVGQYKYNSEENGETVLELSLIDGVLIAQVQQAYAAYFAAELIPEEPVLSDDAREANFTAYAFSGFADEGAYWEPVRVTLALTQTGVTVTEENAAAVSFLRDDSLNSADSVRRCREILGQIASPDTPAPMQGTWTGETADGSRMFLQLGEDGSLLWSCKTDGSPVSIFIGAAADDQKNHILTIAAERVGWGQVPWIFTLEYAPEKDGGLMLKNSDDGGLIPTKDNVMLSQKTEKE